MVEKIKTASYLEEQKKIFRVFPTTVSVFVGYFGLECGFVLANFNYFLSPHFYFKMAVGFILVTIAAVVETARLYVRDKNEEKTVSA